MKKVFFLILSLLLVSCQGQEKRKSTVKQNKMENKLAYATIGGGCFWCVESCFNMLKGVDSVISGYSGGHKANPTYEEVCTGDTGHAEVVQIAYDPAVISYKQLMEVFLFLHDPTQLNRQGNDIGTQYRSVVFYNSEEQKKETEEALKESEAKQQWTGKYVTEVVPFEKFWPAEAYHQGYYKENPTQPYCSAVVGPKIQKFKKYFGEKGWLKPEEN
ncbi:peptide-methionine (S)-S-oxide reductase MsrA [Elizabethkingia anophelis]|uniref:peptide-methionine (S)-S-oxide reductase MsrA n=1 Tax=Elizabethkingia anophelis TaxID=1117645 RepID=UPI000C9CF76F|nr:peptide-methionine (S)-S-oxide reductase MsrA [Elizabethkingia anophelis]MCT3759991.1 peptide-methionine (S)-S-oxide reductase MsrA [Elizabethkingia anophelis]MCT3974725.1 peptide-methionine (S)-S-oxide reductase MsrA [Elizabethkingia anophelis]MCT4002729.1 peptide-methionine (S)-S-oxide reductase MsrA [Elizabethkingia anophelis]MCT4016749.1 peptide-methionine (S)-S-oxide reductase MsrA [Elizabethkingia anophelis]MCT4020310.1 peptide-methionine (S)-S-oxide reductase MsrA [Elizabethkingia an